MRLTDEELRALIEFTERKLLEAMDPAAKKFMQDVFISVLELEARRKGRP